MRPIRYHQSTSHVQLARTNLALGIQHLDSGDTPILRVAGTEEHDPIILGQVVLVEECVVLGGGERDVVGRCVGLKSSDSSGDRIVAVSMRKISVAKRRVTGRLTLAFGRRQEFWELS